MSDEPARAELGWVADTRRVTALTGAGMSTDSGIPDYRGPQGLWRRDPEAEKLVTYQYYMSDPEVRRRSWLSRRDNPAWNAVPNAAHHALVDVEHANVPLRIITQNVDGLHQQAGSTPRKVFELHGSMFHVVCTECAAQSSMEEALERVASGEQDPRCLYCGGIQKSGTVMFGQRLPDETLHAAASAASSCDLFLAVGTSLQVEPAASLCRLAVDRGAHLVVVNGAPTPYDDIATAVLRESVSAALPRITATITAGPAGGRP